MLALPVLQFLRGVDIREPPRFIGKIHLHGFVTAQPVAGPAFALFQAVLPESPVLQRGIKVWGPLVRLFHWLLVAAFTIVWLTSEEESRLHELAGYTVIGLVLIRIVWGFIGTRYARFSDFVYRPSIVPGYARETPIGKTRRYRGAPPAGRRDDPGAAGHRRHPV